MSETNIIEANRQKLSAKEKKEKIKAQKKEHFEANREKYRGYSKKSYAAKKICETKIKKCIELFNLSEIQKENIYSMIKKHQNGIYHSVAFGAMALHINGVFLFEIIETLSARGHQVNKRMIRNCMIKYNYKPPLFDDEAYINYYLNKLKVSCSELKLQIIKNVSKTILKIKRGAPHTAASTAIFLVLQQEKKYSQNEFAELLEISVDVVKFVLRSIKKQRKNIIAGIRKNLKQIGELS